MITTTIITITITRLEDSRWPVRDAACLAIGIIATIIIIIIVIIRIYY